MSYCVPYCSEFDGTPCAMIITGVFGPCRNTKTGDMSQVWFLPVDSHPSNDLQPVCGKCPLSNGICYARRGHTILAAGKVWKAHQRGAYTRLDLANDEHIHAIQRKPMRIGALGDPASMLDAWWLVFFRNAPRLKYTGYTHHWRTRCLSQWFMASCETARDVYSAQYRGYSTFRMRENESDVVVDRYTRQTRIERNCPASAENGRRSTCSKCLRCNGRNGQRFIAINQH